MASDDEYFQAIGARTTAYVPKFVMILFTEKSKEVHVYPGSSR